MDRTHGPGQPVVGDGQAPSLGLQAASVATTTRVLAPRAAGAVVEVAQPL